MTLERPLRVSLHILVATGLLALTLALGSALWFVGSLSAFAFLVVLGALRPQWHVSGLVAACGVLIVLQAVAAEVFLTRDVLVPAAHYLICTQLIWMTNERSSRNYGWIGLLSVLQLALAGVLSVDLSFGLCFVLFVPVGVLALVLLNLRFELERNRLLKPSRLERVRLGRRLLAAVLLVAVLQLAFTVLVFMYFPRSGRQLLQLQPVARGNRLAGFSDEVSLGEIGSILDNPDVVMRVIFLRDGEPTQAVGFPLRMRGMSLDVYENGRWRAEDLFNESDAYPLPWPDSPITMNPVTDVVQKVNLEPLPSRVIFHLWRPVHLVSDSPNLEEVLIHRATDTWTTIRSGGVSRQYTVRSRIELYPKSELMQPMRPATFRDENYAQLPISLTPRVRELAERICEGIPLENRYERVLAIQQYLERNYTYTLRPGMARAGTDPIEDFLFRTREGHCEYFAGAMVVLLRCVGIPSRMVTGFAGGQWNDYGQFYIIRQRDAHAWVEARFRLSRGVAWLAFDPTPERAAEDESMSGWLAAWSQRLDAFRMWWNLYIVNYSRHDQQKISDAVTSLLSRIPGSLPTWGRSVLSIPSGASGGAKAVALLVAGLGLLCGTGVVLWRLARRGSGRSRTRRGGRPSLAFYRKLDEMLRKRGYRRGPAVTPAEFARQVIETGGEPFLPVAVVTDAFCRVRYGGRRLTAGEHADIRRALAALEAAGSRR